MRPRASPGLVATLVEQAPARLVKKLDAEPAMAEAWRWETAAEGWTVTTDRDERVTLRGPYLTEIAQVSCTCLLSPKCLHLLAAVSALDVGDAPDEDDALEARNADEGPDADDAPEARNADEGPEADDAPEARNADAETLSAEGRGAPDDDGAVDAEAEPEAKAVPTEGRGAPGVTPDHVPADARGAPGVTPDHVSAEGRGVPRVPPGQVADEGRAPGVTPDPAAAGQAVELDEAQRRAAARLQVVGMEALAAGADALGAVRQAELLRAVHACRAEGLHRAAAAGIRVVRRARSLHAARPDLRLGDLVADLHDLLSTTAALTVASPGEARASPVASVSPVTSPGEARPAPTAAHVGVARRAYAPVAGLRLYGLFCEPVIAASGHAGVVTWLCDATGALYRIASIRPGPPTRAVATYAASPDFGGVTLPHRRLCRAGLFVQRATLSADGRLGGGREATAAPAGPSAWTEPPLDRLWATPLAEQVERAFAAYDLPEEDRAPPLLFVTGVVLGADDALRLQVGEVDVRVVAPSDHPDLRYRDNLRRLAGAPGLRLRAILRLEPDAPECTARLLAFGPDGPANADGLRPAPAWGGRVNAGLDALQGNHLRAGLPHELQPRDPTADPTAAVRRRLGQVALGGRAALPPEAAADVAREAARLERLMLPTGAALLRAVSVAATRAGRDLHGARTATDPAPLARAWTAAATWERATTRHLRKSAWTHTNPHG